MRDLILKYEQKLVQHGLCEPGTPLLGVVEASPVWNRETEHTAVLNRVFENLNILALLYASPAEPYLTIIRYLAQNADGHIIPEDCETRTFLHDLPVTADFKAETIAGHLKQRKCLILKQGGIITYGTVSPEQAFVTFSSVCFACLVKFFSDYLAHKQSGIPGPEETGVMRFALERLAELPDSFIPLSRGPFTAEETVYAALEQAGRLTVDYGLVDSYFGNISCRYQDTLYISQTGSSLDELAGFIDPCPLDNSACTGITASSELSAHKQVILDTGCRTVLHGHPRFAVIMSLICDRKDCSHNGRCHLDCPYPRQAGSVPIVPGEVGTGRFGLCRTVPPALKAHPGVIVYGHGVFTTGRVDFNEAFGSLLKIERDCRDLYREQIGL